MNVFKHDVITIGNYIYFDGGVDFTISYDAKVTHKHIDIPSFMHEGVFYNIYRLSLCIAAYSYAIIAKKVVVNIPISKAQYDFLERIKPSYYANLRVFLGKMQMAPTSLGVVSFTFDENFEEGVVGGIIPNTATLLYSGGKESLLSSIILEEAGIKHSKLLVNSGLYTDVSKIKNFEDCSIIETSDAFLFDDSVIYDGTWDNPAFAFERIVFAIIDMVSNRHQYLCVGNEYETTAISFDGFGGSLNYGRSWQQSNFALKEFQRYLYFIGYDGAEVFSPVQNMTMIFEEAALAFRYPDKLDTQCSCTSTITEDGFLQPCFGCIKCRILNAILVGFNKILSKSNQETIKSKLIYDIGVKTVPSTPVHYGEHYLDNEQLQQVENLLTCNFEESYFNLIFDSIHSEEFLPSSVYKVVRNIECSIKKIVEQWKK